VNAAASSAAQRRYPAGRREFIDYSRTVRSEQPDFARISLIVPRDRLPRSLRERDLQHPSRQER
jgi:hypothetical protein